MYGDRHAPQRSVCMFGYGNMTSGQRGGHAIVGSSVQCQIQLIGHVPGIWLL
jgi:hypothetical protein